jgi:GT2 family glycosyltransferase
MSAPVSISVSVINWNGRDCIERCLESLLAQTGVALDVVVLDNGSTDGSLDVVRARFPNLKIIANGRNLGFAAAHNKGFRATRGEWHFVLNQDVYLAQDYLQKLMEATATDARIGAAAGKLWRLETSGGHKILDSCGIEMFAGRRVWDRGTGEMDHGQYDESCDVFGCCAAAAIYRRTMLEQIARDGEVFGEIFFAYYEDADLAWRMNAAGWRSLHVPQATASHVRGGSTQGSKITRQLVFRNRYLLLARNDAWRDLLRDASAILVFEAVQLLRLIRYPYLFSGILEFWKRWPRALRERHAMRMAWRLHFGLRDLRKFIVPGSGIRRWIAQAQSDTARKEHETHESKLS